MAKKIKGRKKSSKQLKALRELHNIVTKWTDEDFDKKGPFSDYCEIQRKKDKKMEKLLTDADLDNLSIGSFTNYLEDNSFREEDFDDDSDYNNSYKKKTKKKKKQKKSNIKKPLTAFNFFCKEKGAEIRKTNPSLKDHDFWSALSDKWKKLNEKEKQIYVKLSEKDKKRYEKEVNKDNIISKKIKKKIK